MAPKAKHLFLEKKELTFSSEQLELKRFSENHADWKRVFTRSTSTKANKLHTIKPIYLAPTTNQELLEEYSKSQLTALHLIVAP